MTRDWVKQMARYIADGDTAKLAEATAKAIREIEAEMRALQEQAALIRRLNAFYVPPMKPSSVPVTKESTPLQVSPTVDDGLDSRERGALVRRAALELAKQGKADLVVRDVLDELARQGIRFSIKRPGSMVGTVLASMREFDRQGLDNYHFVGSK